MAESGGSNGARPVPETRLSESESLIGDVCMALIGEVGWRSLSGRYGRVLTWLGTPRVALGVPAALEVGRALVVVLAELTRTAERQLVLVRTQHRLLRHCGEIHRTF